MNDYRSVLLFTFRYKDTVNCALSIVNYQLSISEKVFQYYINALLPFRPAQKTDHRLQKRIEQLLNDFNGTVGVYVHDLKKDRMAEANADTLFPTASVI